MHTVKHSREREQRTLSPCLCTQPVVSLNVSCTAPGLAVADWVFGLFRFKFSLIRFTSALVRCCLQTESKCRPSPNQIPTQDPLVKTSKQPVCQAPFPLSRIRSQSLKSCPTPYGIIVRVGGGVSNVIKLCHKN